MIFHGNVSGQGPGYSPSLGLRRESRLKPKAAAKGIAAMGSEEEAHPLNPLVRLAIAPTDCADCRRPTAATGRGVDDRIGEHKAVSLVPDALQILVRMTLLDVLAHSSRVSWKGKAPPTNAAHPATGRAKQAQIICAPPIKQHPKSRRTQSE